MVPRRSPTLELAERVDRAQSEGRKAWSASTPVFPRPASLPEAHAGWTKLSPAEGLQELRELAEASFFQHWDLPDHKCIVTAGAKAAIFSTLRAVASPGRRVIIPVPAWPSYFDLCAIAGVEPVEFPLSADRDFQIDPARLEAVVRDTEARAIVLSNPANPTGRILGQDELNELARTSARHDCMLIIDQSFSGFIFDHARWRASTVRGHDNLVLVDSFSKNMALQGARVGIALLPERLHETVLSLHQTIVSAAPSPSQYMALHALRHHARPADLDAQRKLALDLIRDLGWQCHDQGGTFYFFPRPPDVDRLRANAEKRDVFILTGEAFGGSFADHFRLCFGRDADELEMILDRLRKAATE